MNESTQIRVRTVIHLRQTTQINDSNNNNIYVIINREGWQSNTKLVKCIIFKWHLYSNPL